MPDTHIHHGFDIGGTKIELLTCDDALQTLFRRRIDTPRDDYAAFQQAIVDLVDAAEGELGQRGGVGIGLPGVRDADGVQLSSNVPAVSGRKVAEDLHARLQRPLQLGNDCQCFALSEAYGGAGDGQPSMFAAILGTGIGGGYCVQGQLVRGRNGIAGEWGHTPLPAPLIERHGLPVLDCPCGLRGCFELYASGTGLARLHRHLGGASADASAVVTAAANGDAVAQRAVAIHLDLLGHGLASIVLTVDPHVIVLGGGLSKYEPLYEHLPAAVAAHLFKGVRVPPILPPKFGDAGGARGAALLARQHAAR